MATQSKQRGSNRQNPNRYPPQECASHEWVRRTQTANYRRAIKRSVERLDTVRLIFFKQYRSLSRKQVDALHWMADPYTFESGRRDKAERVETNPNAAPTDSVKY